MPQSQARCWPTSTARTEEESKNIWLNMPGQELKEHNIRSSRIIGHDRNVRIGFAKQQINVRGGVSAEFGDVKMTFHCEHDMSG